ncbi:hypothetical protein DICVIV_02619 [Dictyocaulus viviparus]|uniref:Uncharacterized protein n=1 Tax=Dictyocaulus viviparus TaxID=29172 RepID=A0A0D8Y5K2_DICVI|nr:hypothetical protein DICVIV_02619 [Dictyocaulus viviparus]
MAFRYLIAHQILEEPTGRRIEKYFYLIHFQVPVHFLYKHILHKYTTRPSFNGNNHVGFPLVNATRDWFSLRLPWYGSFTASDFEECITIIFIVFEVDTT